MNFGDEGNAAVKRAGIVVDSRLDRIPDFTSVSVIEGELMTLL
jgi:hypothetical protein